MVSVSQEEVIRHQCERHPYKFDDFLKTYHDDDDDDNNCEDDDDEKEKYYSRLPAKMAISSSSIKRHTCLYQLHSVISHLLDNKWYL